MRFSTCVNGSNCILEKRIIMLLDCNVENDFNVVVKQSLTLVDHPCDNCRGVIATTFECAKFSAGPSIDG